MHKSLKISLVVIAGISFGLSGCGDESSSTLPSNQESLLTPTDIEVERGPVYEATVKDASGKIAIQQNGKNIYTFSDTPAYPVTVNGGWIDLDDDGIKDDEDIVLDINMTSYSNIVTPITTLCSNPDKSKRDELESKLAQELGVSILELKKLPSKAVQNVAVLTNAIFKVVKENNTTIANRFNYENIIESTNHNNYMQLISEYNSINIVAESSVAMTNGVFDAKKLEQYIVNENDNIFTTVNEENNDSTPSIENNETDDSTTYDIAWKSKGYNEITSPHTGRIWLDRNLGASKICETSNDTGCIGDYYQWGRQSDGHEKVNSNWTTTKLESITSLSNAGFYKAYQGGEWLNNAYEITDKDYNGTKREAQWAKTDATSICPIGYKVPSSEELKAETLDVGIDEPSKMLNNFLKIISTGKRTYHVYIDDEDEIFLWSRTTSYVDSSYLHFYDYRPNGGTGVGGNISSTSTRATGMPIRCIKDDNSTGNLNQNINPIANAGVDQNITTGVNITLNASNSSDSDGTISTYQWKEGSVILSNDLSFSKSDFSLGTHIITLTVTDNDDATHTDSITIVVSFPQYTEEILTFNNKTYRTVQSPSTGKIWLDRNLGANQICTTFDDAECYGDYYQWGRLTDGHESNNSNLTETPATSINSNNNLFIKTTNTFYGDWVDETGENVINPNIDGNGSLRNQNWNKLDGSAICPLGFRVPSIEELKGETLDIGIQKRDDIFNSFLKIPSAGNRFGGDGEFYFKGNRVYLWSNSIHEEDYYQYSQYIYFEYTYGNSGFSSRADGKSIRCIKD